MIKKLIAWSRATEIDDVANRLTKSFATSGLTDAYLSDTFSVLNGKQEELSRAINRPKAASQLKEKDKVRDSRARALYQLLNGYACHPDETINSAAQTLLKVFSNYGTALTRESYASESSLLVSLLLSFAQPEHQPDIAALSGCAALIAALQAAQDDFEQTRIAYETAKAKEGMLKTASKIKKEVAEIINQKTVIYLSAMEQADPARYTEFAATVAVIIAENNGVVKKRKQQPDSDKPED